MLSHSSPMLNYYALLTERAGMINNNLSILCAIINVINNDFTSFERDSCARRRCSARADVVRRAAKLHGYRKLCRGSPVGTCAATKSELPDRALDVEFDARHPREQIDIHAPDRASAEPHLGRHQIERLHQDADILENERIGEGAVLP